MTTDGTMSISVDPAVVAPEPAREQERRYVGRSCPQCGSEQSRVRISGQDNYLQRPRVYYVSACAGCGLLFQNPSLPVEELGAHYPDDYEPFQVEEDFSLNRTARWYIRERKGYGHLPAVPRPDPLRRWWGQWTAGQQLVPTFRPGGRLLEIGCASGGRLAMFRDLGWTCTGIEYSDFAAGKGRARGLDVRTGRVEDVLDALPEQDAVISSFVIEHLENPYQVARAVASKLRPGGEYIFSTVFVNSLDRHLYGEHWLHWDLPRHYTYFRHRDIERMLAGHFEITGVYHKPSATDFIGSSEYRIFREGGPRMVDRLVHSLGHRNLQRLCVPLAAARRTSRIVIHARKV